MAKKIKIAFYISTLNGGGAERVYVTLLRQLDPNKFDIYLILVSKVGVFLPQVPDYVKIIDLKRKRTIFSILPLREVIKSIQPEIICSTLFHNHIAIDLALIGLKNKPKTIYTSPTSPKIVLARNEISKPMKYFIDRAYKNATRVLAQTPEMKEEINEYHFVDDAKIDVFLNPIDTKMIDDKTANQSNPFDTSFINIVVAGRLSDVKGFDVLIRSMKNVLEKNANFFLHIIGRDAGELHSLEALAKELSVTKNIKFWGFQNNPYKFFYFSDLFVLSSRREGLPNAVLENIYIQKPVIATRCIPYMSALIEDGVSGFLVEVEDSNGLANAILDYKKIDPTKYDYMDKLTDVNVYFENV